MAVIDKTAESRSAVAPDRMTGRHKAVLGLLLGSQFMLAADFSLLNVAIPDIGASLHFAMANLQWIATAFALASAGFTLIFGRVSDVLGRRRMFMIGMLVLVAASVLGALAQNPAELIGARIAQGLATAITTPAALALLTTSFPEGPLREKALGLNGALMSAGFTAGAVTGGVLTGLLNWRWAFLLNIAVGVVVLLLAPALLEESRSSERAKMDLPGGITVSLGLISLVYGIATAGQKGWGNTGVLAAIAAGVVLLVAFWFIERRAEAPLASVRILSRPTVGWGNFGGLVTFTMETAVIFLMTLYLQQVLHYSPLATGLAFGLLGAAAFFGGALAPRIIGKLTSRRALVIGLLVQAAATASLFWVGDQRSALALVLAATSIGGFGHVLAIVGYMVTATSGLSNDEQGLATGLTSVTQQVGITIGIPIMSTLAVSRIHSLSTTHSAVQATLGGVTSTILVDAGVVALGALLIALFLRKPSSQS